ncbi:hypothetical protein [Marinicrinis sediminis]|uniref:Uncharacterized protein n=1 Tax=Marinicrinis sediminis TaxID=1652465 RepID=A0ABW5R9B5_9BACL
MRLYYNGQALTEDIHFEDHIEHAVPIQIYEENAHYDIGFVERYDGSHVIVNQTRYPRSRFHFVSRPGY